MQALLKTLLDESFYAIQQARQSVPRSIRFPQVEQMIKVAIGMRRAGKTYTLYQKINALLDQGINKGWLINAIHAL